MSVVSQTSWQSLWQRIEGEGLTLWKDGEQHFQIVQDYLEKKGLLNSSPTIFIPLAGDCLYASQLYSRGFSVTCTELVEQAVERMKRTFGTSWLRSEVDGCVLWETEDKRGRIWQGNHFDCVKLEKNKFDLVYDKDSFGALPPLQRTQYVQSIESILKEKGHVFLMGAHRMTEKDQGPPYHLEEDVIRENWKRFEILDHMIDFYPLSSQIWKNVVFFLKFS
eukprot:TRINITY_DN11254_c0_g2_i1.p1 TRINITY_DN11254_c0_g2~~TRINITY_DN11254_c0_g2_i1.p1  ORF type:complete len:238 (-),score=59.59 TRINITY_DN11254_c0_g2_i1:206-868(-)